MSISVPLAVTMMIGTVEWAADRPAHVDARQAGQHQVEEDQIGLHFGEEAERLGPVDGDGHVEALAGQTDDQCVHERLVVLGQEHPGLGGHVEIRPPVLVLAHAVTLTQLASLGHRAIELLGSRRVFRRVREDQGEGRPLALP